MRYLGRPPPLLNTWGHFCHGQISWGYRYQLRGHCFEQKAKRRIQRKGRLIWQLPTPQSTVFRSGLLTSSSFFYSLYCALKPVFFSTIFRQLQANTCRNSELEERFGWVRQKNGWVRAKFARFLLDFGSVSLFLQGFCLKIPKFWVRW